MVTAKDGRVEVLVTPFSGFGVMADAADFDPVTGKLTCDGWHDDFPGWSLTFTAIQTPRGPEIVELTIKPKDEPPPGGLQARLLRALSLDRVQRLVAGIAASLVSDFDDPEVDAWSAQRRPGKPGKPDREFAVWAARYIEALTSPRPIADLANQWHLSQSQVRNIVWACRQRGLLTASMRGRAGGELTDKARRLLREGAEH